MAQIVTNKAISTRCNLVAIQTGGSKANTVLASGEIWLVDTTNANKGTNGVGLYDSYITGDGTTAAKNLTVRKIDTGTDDSKDIDFRANAGECEENVITVNDSVKECLIAIDDDLGDVHNILGQVDEELGAKADKATTLAGYGITDAHINNGVVTLGSDTITPAVINDNVLGGTTYSSLKIDRTYAKPSDIKLDFDEGDTGTNADLSTSYVTYAPQSMTSAQKAQARENIGAIGASEVATDIAGCVKTTTDQTIAGHKTFTGEVTIDNAVSPYTTLFTGDTTIEGQLKYTKKNTGAASLESGVLMRDNLGNVYSTLLNQSDWNQMDSTATDYIKNKPTIPASQVQVNWNETDTSSLAFIQNKPTIPEFVDVSSMFATNPELPSEYTMAQLQTKNLYAVVDGNRFPVTLKYSSSAHNGRFFYVDYDGSDISCEESPVSIGETVNVNGRIQDTNGNKINNVSIVFVPSKSSYEGISFASVNPTILPDQDQNFSVGLKTGMTYRIDNASTGEIITTISHPFFTTDAVTGFDITM